MSNGSSSTGSFLAELQRNPFARVLLLLGANALAGPNRADPSIVDACKKLDAEIEIGVRRLAVLEALRLRHKWRTADLPRLEKLDLPPVALRRLEKLELRPRKGRGVIREFLSASEILWRGLSDDFRRVDPATRPHERLAYYKKTKWFPEFIEAAYRGELAIAQKRVARAGSRPGRAHELAEREVAEAAGISPAMVRKYCHQERVARRGQRMELTAAPTSAARLKRHLEHGVQSS